MLHQLVHLQYLNWNDHSIPDNTKVIKSVYQEFILPCLKSGLPFIAHCSAGVGRTGVLVGAVYFFDLFLHNQLTSIAHAMKLLRKQRAKSVQSLKQYAYMQLLLVEMTEATTKKSYPTIKEALQKKKVLFAEMPKPISDYTIDKYPFIYQNLFQECIRVAEIDFKEYLKLADKYETEINYVPPKCLLITNTARSASTKYCPFCQYNNVYLRDETRVTLKNGEYIHASYIQSTPEGQKLIAAQAPLQTTTEEFWQMALQQKCQKILMLCRVVEDGKIKSQQYWPKAAGETLYFEKIDIQNINVLQKTYKIGGKRESNVPT
uniref:Protein tyrosine phosphatase n=1 Tax=Panagrolaimus davidi TaxID=227884 RepID=A0A914QKA1_9BILA